MPGTALSLGPSARITPSALSFLCARGLRRMTRRPWFEPVVPPPPPSDDMKPSTFGSLATIAATCRWRRRMASNEVPSIVSVVPVIWSMSSLGMNLLGRDHEQHGGADQDRDREHQRDAAVVHHPQQAPAVGAEPALEHALRRAIEPPAVAVLDPEEAAAHHRRQRQRHEARHQDRDADHDRELVEQPPEQAAHEQHRDEHGHERQRHRQDREADLARALLGGLSGGFPISMCRTMFSSMTIASSTTKPTDNVNASKDKLSRLNRAAALPRTCRPPTAATPGSRSASRSRCAGTGRSRARPSPERRAAWSRRR